ARAQGECARHVLLDGDAAHELAVDRQINDAETAFADHALDFELAQIEARSERIRRRVNAARRGRGLWGSRGTGRRLLWQRFAGARRVVVAAHGAPFALRAVPPRGSERLRSGRAALM